MYAKYITTGDIEFHMKKLYGIDISNNTISRIVNSKKITKDIDKIKTILKKQEVIF